MLFEVVVMCENEILLDEKIAAENRDQVLIKVGRRLEEDGICDEEVTAVHVRQFGNVTTFPSPTSNSLCGGSLTSTSGITTFPNWWVTNTSTSL